MSRRNGGDSVNNKSGTKPGSNFKITDMHAACFWRKSISSCVCCMNCSYNNIERSKCIPDKISYTGGK